ncbi:nickel pincer cofactor biosynthesis protein LarC [Solirubrobacter sp. CPCC 204708]|uniref:Pyridinium-3,5-bisthiocarboxylic acid mononucleotide nickel insertion protein n=1 Tax=Solirubrobacter deserti TaxID=2282478 RepID=A0ABT4RCT3_9ACTN|nr:nickel pincer cofactor biosynthesis protein LarC [Solirubrobacter deserti]MBE2317879.1 nickel pincer cofactor biosynthesis protein LarC [Solirubrobacter deserti]MDA0136344.1 nickel pincer cofactor biosynthesis protein LarC [Solirubrobacter deserti]
MIAYLDCIGGAAGDMLLGALLDAGAEVDLSAFELQVERGTAERHGITAVTTTVTGAAEQPHRDWGTIRDLISAASLPERVEARAQEAFKRLAIAEGRIHGIEPERVHFHEVGAIDAIGEIVGVALALESLNVDRVICSPLPLGRGFVKAAHGNLPLPAPATLELLKGAPVHGVELELELVTPTGAALVAALAESYGPLPRMTVQGTGYGAGTRELEPFPNVVRVILGTEATTGTVSLIEANLDDLLPELAPDAAAACFAAGALDVWTTPVTMKHGRPGFVLSALARPDDQRAVIDAVLRETSTLGVRVAHLDRVELERDHLTVEVAGEPVRVKIGRLDGKIVNLAPEHADCERAARITGDAVKTVWARALAAAHEVAA